MGIWGNLEGTFKNRFSLGKPKSDVYVERSGSDLTFRDLVVTTAQKLADLVSVARSGQISAVTEKASPVSADVLLLEDSADSNNKKRVQIGNLPGGGSNDKVKITSNDTIADYLQAKLIGTANRVTASEVGDGGDEDLQLDVGSDIIDKTTAGQIAVVAEKATPVSADVLLLEDSAASNAKKRVQVGNLPDSDEKVKVTSNDTTPDYLQAKLIGTANRVTTSEVGDGTNEDLQLDVGSDIIDKTTAGQIVVVAEKTTPVANDELLIEDSASSNAKKSLKVGNLKAGALPVGAPSDVGTANAEGSSTDLVRRDHVHKRAYPKEHMTGLAPVYVSASSMGIDPGSCRSDDDTTNIDVTSQLTAAFGSSGAGGLDTGSEASNTWYYLWLISKADGADPAAMISASSSSPTMPGTYTKKEIVGSFRNDGSSNIIPYRCRAEGRTREYTYTHLNDRTVTQFLYDSTAEDSDWELVSAASYVPPTSTYMYLYVVFEGPADGVEFTNDNSNSFGDCWRCEAPGGFGSAAHTHFLWIETTSGQGIYYQADDNEPIYLIAAGYKEQL